VRKAASDNRNAPAFSHYHAAKPDLTNKCTIFPSQEVAL